MSTEFDNPKLNEFISSMYLDSDLADVHFTFPNDDPSARVPALKGILAAASPVFKAMFYGSLREGDTVELTDSNASAFQEFLQFFYLPKINLTIENIEEVIRLADKYDMLDCFETCAAFLEAKLTNVNMVLGYQLASLLNNSKLKEFCEQKIQEFAVDVLKSKAFLQCERTVVEQILKLEKLSCSEVDLFDGCIAWAKSSCEKNGLNAADSTNLKDQLGPCFYLIRFGAMTGEEICKILSNQVNKKLFNQDELIEIMQMLHMKNFQSKIFKSDLRLKFSNDSNDLICRRNDATYRLGSLSVESTWFTTNKPLLLKQIQFDVKLHSDTKPVAMMDVRVDILEYNANMLELVSSVPPECTILCTNMCDVGRGKDINNILTLNEPIMIDPKKTYTIRLIPQKLVYCFYYIRPWDTEVQLDDQFTVKFHRNPTNDHGYSLNNGLVSGLVFNRIQ